MILYRPVGLQEMELIYDSGMKVFPARLPQQPIFYPVLQLEYARQIALDWNTKNGGYSGYVTQFKVEDPYISPFETHTVGGSQHQELWIPAEEMEEFNRHIVGHIKVVEAHFGDAFQGFVPDQFGLQGKNAVEQFTLLANSYVYKRMEFYLEIKRNHKAIFLNYPFWQTYHFQNPSLKEKVLQAIKESWLTSFPQIPLPLPAPVAEQSEAYTQHLIHPVEEEVTDEEQTDSDFLVDSEEVMPSKEQESHSLPTSNDEEPAPAQEQESQARHLAASLHPDRTPIKPTASHTSQGLELGSSGTIHEAIEELSKAVEEDPEDVVARTSLGVAFHRSGEDDRALSCYEAALKIDPNYAEAHYFRANILYNRGNAREAITEYTRAIGLEPELIDAHQKPIPPDRLTDYRPAPAEMHRIAKPAYRILELNKALEVNPRQANLFKERAAEYDRLGNYEQAIADYSSSLAIQPDDAPALHLRGVAYEQLGQRDQARKDYQRAVAINPQLSGEYIQRGVTLGQMGNLRQSIANLTEGIRLAPQNPDAYFNRGTSYFQLGDLERAIDDFSNVIRLSPSDEEAYYWRGISNEAAGHPREAIADYGQFLAISQNSEVRDEIEQRLSQWKEVKRNNATGQSVVPEEGQKTNPALSEASDLYSLIRALGERGLKSTWFGSGVDCYGENAAELYTFTNQNRPIAGHDFLRIASGIRQTTEGDFQAFDPGGTSHWILIRAWHGSGFYIEIDDPKIEEQLKSHLQAIEEVEGAYPPYKGLFLPI